MTDLPKLALITGASSGIGLELALLFAGDGFDLVLCAEDAELEVAAARCRALGVSVVAVQTDLSKPAGVEELYEATVATGQALGAACLNAGVGQGGAFVDAPLPKLLEIVDLNVRSTVHLAHLVLGDMVTRNQGRLLITSSIASTMPGSFQAVYNASKSFDQSFAEALQNELKETEVTVTSLMPGPVDTEFFERGDLTDTKMGRGKKDDPADVAEQGYRALLAGKDRVVAASLATKVGEVLNKVTPDKLKAEGHRQMAHPDK